jgi:hypothetical protein
VGCLAAPAVAQHGLREGRPMTDVSGDDELAVFGVLATGLELRA